MTETNRDSQRGFIWRLIITILLIAYGCIVLVAHQEYFLELHQQEGCNILLFPGYICDLYISVRSDIENLVSKIVLYLLDVDPSGIPEIDEFYIKSVSNLHALFGLLISRTIAFLIWFVSFLPFGILLIYKGILERKVRHEDSDYASPFVQRTALFFVRVSILAIILFLLAPIGLHAYCLPLMILLLFIASGFFIGSVQVLKLKISR